MKEFIKYFLRKNIIYVIFTIFIILNIICFPDLLNQNDIKLNDLSWTVQHSSHIPSTTNLQTNTLTDNTLEVYTNNLEIIYIQPIFIIYYPNSNSIILPLHNLHKQAHIY